MKDSRGHWLKPAITRLASQNTCKINIANDILNKISVDPFRFIGLIEYIVGSKSIRDLEKMGFKTWSFLFFEKVQKNSLRVAAVQKKKAKIPKTSKPTAFVFVHDHCPEVSSASKT